MPLGSLRCAWRACAHACMGDTMQQHHAHETGHDVGTLCWSRGCGPASLHCCECVCQVGALGGPCCPYRTSIWGSGGVRCFDGEPTPTSRVHRGSSRRTSRRQNRVDVGAVHISLGFRRTGGSSRVAAEIPNFCVGMVGWGTFVGTPVYCHDGPPAAPQSPPHF